MSKEIPTWICRDCGLKYGKSRGGVTTFHMNNCDWCGEKKSVCHCRNYSYPELPDNSKRKL